jgi:prepilin-type N-terminal cleavage/methylation domain-containing protein
MKKIINRGFTLIELLVVIAIIGILASIVLVSLNSARNKGKDTRVISDVNQIRTQIEAEATAGGAYSIGCLTANANTLSGSGNCGTLATDASNNGGAIAVVTVPNSGAANTSYTAYAVHGTLVTANNFYCVDSTGQTKSYTAAPASWGTTGVCP